MVISKQIITTLFVLISCTDIFAKPAIPNSTKLGELNGSLVELKKQTMDTWTTMNLLRKKRGYPGRSLSQCMLPTYLLYNKNKYQFYNANTMHRHLQKIKDTLSPLYDASYAKRFAKNETNQSFVDALKQGYSMAGDIKAYNDTRLTNHVQKYMNCAKNAGSPIPKNAEQFLRHATYVEAVDIVMTDLGGDILFIKDYLSKKH